MVRKEFVLDPVIIILTIELNQMVRNMVIKFIILKLILKLIPKIKILPIDLGSVF